MATVEFCLKSMCDFGWYCIVVREVHGKKKKVIYRGGYNVVSVKYASRNVVSAYVDSGALYLDLQADCKSFICCKKESCILDYCLVAACPYCNKSMCDMCLLKMGCCYDNTGNL